MFIAGIDPGMSGAIVIIKKIVESTELEIFPLTKIAKGEIDIHAAATFLKIEQPDLVIIEKVNGLPLWGCVSNFNLGKISGEMIGICAALFIPYQLVRAQEWKKKVLVGMDWKGNKNASILYAKRKHPEISLKRTIKCKKDDDNIADALCMAEYGRMIQ